MVRLQSALFGACFALAVLTSCAPQGSTKSFTPQLAKQQLPDMQRPVLILSPADQRGVQNFSEIQSASSPLKIVCAKGHLFGTDVSNYTVNTNWNQAHAGGVKFAIIKANEGDFYINPLFANDWKNSRKAGLIRGAYHLFHPSDNPTLSAEQFLKVMGPLQPTDLPPVLDIELTDGLQSSTIVQNALTWLKIVQANTGRVPIVYTYSSFGDANLSGSPILAHYPLWIANTNPIVCPPIPDNWNNWVMWQYKIGPVPGVQGTNGDLDSFNGSYLDLENFIANSQQ